jgi:hypothetical protein
MSQAADSPSTTLPRISFASAGAVRRRPPSPWQDNPQADGTTAAVSLPARRSSTPAARGSISTEPSHVMAGVTGPLGLHANGAVI